MLGNQVSTLAHVLGESEQVLDVPLLALPSVRRGGIGVIQHQPRNLVHIEVRKGAHVVAAEGAFPPGCRAQQCGMVKRGIKLLAMCTLVRGMGPGSLNPAPARS